MWKMKELPGGRYRPVEVDAERSGSGWIIEGLVFIHDVELASRCFGVTKEDAIAAQVAYLDKLIDATEFCLGLHKASRDELKGML